MTEQTSNSEQRVGRPAKNFWETAEKVSKTLSIAAIPIVLAIVGWMIQKRLQDQTLRRDYVQLAVTVLKEPASSQDMKNWAVDLLSANSPVPFSREIQVDLSTGKIQIPATFDVSPATVVSNVTSSTNSKDQAGDLERKGLEALFNRDADAALQAFKEAEKNWPTYHNVAEIRKLLESRLNELTTAPKDGPSDSWKAVYVKIQKDYSWGLTPETKSTLADRVAKS